MLSGIDGVLLVTVIGHGKLVVPGDVATHRPDPMGLDAPCRDKLLMGTLAIIRRRAAATTKA